MSIHPSMVASVAREMAPTVITDGVFEVNDTSPDDRSVTMYVRPKRLYPDWDMPQFAFGVVEWDEDATPEDIAALIDERLRDVASEWAIIKAKIALPL